MAIKIPSRDPKQIGSVTPISGNTKWIGAAAAGGEGARKLGDKIIAASRQMASVFAEELDKQEKTNLFHEKRGHMRNFEYGTDSDTGEFGANSPYSMINTASYGEYDPETNMMSNEVNLRKLPQDIAAMYDQYRKDHIDIIENDYVRNRMIDEHAASRANAIVKAQQQSILYRKAQATSGYITDLNQTIDRLAGGNLEQIQVAYDEVGDILGQFHLHPNLSPDLKYKYEKKAFDAYTTQRAYRAVTFDNLGFDYPTAGMTPQGELVATTADQYDTAIRLLSGDFSILLDPNFTEEKKQQIIDSVMALDNGDMSMPAGGQRASLIERLKKNKEIREGVIEKNQNLSLLNIKKELDTAMANGDLTVDLLNKTAPPHVVGQDVYNFYYGKIGKTKKTELTTDETKIWRKIERELRIGNSSSVELQKIQSKYLADPNKTTNDVQSYILSKIPDLPQKYWDKIPAMIKESAENWDLSKARANASDLAENALLLHILNPQGQDANDLLSGSKTITEALAALANQSEGSITEARNQVQTLMLNFEEVLDLTLKRNQQAKGISYEDQLRAPLYVKDEKGNSVIIDGTANNNYIVNQLIRTMMGDVSANWIPTQAEAQLKKTQDRAEAKQNQNNRTYYSGSELTDQMGEWIATNAPAENLLGTTTQIKFQDGSVVDLTAPQGVSAEQMQAMYWNQMALIQTGDPAKVIRIPEDHPIPEGWTTRTEPWKLQQARAATVIPQMAETAQQTVNEVQETVNEVQEQEYMADTVNAVPIPSMPIRGKRTMYHPSGATVFAYSDEEADLYLKNGYYETKEEANSENK